MAASVEHQRRGVGVCEHVCRSRQPHAADPLRGVLPVSRVGQPERRHDRLHRRRRQGQ